MKNQKRVSQPAENVHSGGILLAPTPSLQLHNYQQPPPLLPLPIHYSLSSRSPYLSCCPLIRKSNRSRDPSLKKLKNAISKAPNNYEFFIPVEKISSVSFDVTSANPLGPASKVTVKNFERFSGSMFILSPPPSSLPLPKFPLRPKLINCNAEAAGVDAEATDNLCRLLRLR